MDINETLRLHKMWFNNEKNGYRAYFGNTELEKLDFENKDLRCISFENSKVVSCNFIGADLQHCNFKGAILAFCDFKNANTLNCDFTKVDLGSCRNIIQFGPIPSDGDIITAVKHDDGWKIPKMSWYGEYLFFTLDELEAMIMEKYENPFSNRIRETYKCPAYLGLIKILRKI